MQSLPVDTNTASVPSTSDAPPALPLNTIPALQPEAQRAPAVPCASMLLPNGWTLSVSGPTDRGEVWVTFRAPAPAGTFASHWVPADGVRGKVMLELMRSMFSAALDGKAHLPAAVTDAQKAGDVIGSTGV